MPARIAGNLNMANQWQVPFDLLRQIPAHHLTMAKVHL